MDNVVLQITGYLASPESPVILHWLYFTWSLNLTYFRYGMGRSGAFLALCICLERMKVESVVDVFQTVRTMRSQRPVMVNTTVSLILSVLFSVLFCFKLGVIWVFLETV